MNNIFLETRDRGQKRIRGQGEVSRFLPIQLWGGGATPNTLYRRLSIYNRKYSYNLMDALHLLTNIMERGPGLIMGRMNI